VATRIRSSAGVQIALWILATVATLFFLKTAKALFLPIAIAVLISYALDPVVTWFVRLRLPRVAATALVMLTILAAAAAGAYSLRDDAAQLVDALPKATQRAREMVQSQLGVRGDVMQESTTGVGTTGRSTEAATDSGNMLGSSGQVGSLLTRVVGSVFTLAGNLVVVFFLVFFLLLSGRHVRDRVIEVAGSDPDRRRTVTTIITDINTQIQRYLVVLVFTAAIVGVATWSVLAIMGVEHAPMWGLLAGVFNSIPYFGPVIVSGGLFAVGMMQGGGTTQALQMAGAAIVITSLEGWLLTPPLMGKAERMSALAVFLGLLLWTWMWGGWGTILAVPMLVIVKSVADHVQPLKPVGRLMAP
jgi:predicted PurR-regulated permease PerM